MRVWGEMVEGFRWVINLIAGVRYLGGVCPVCEQSIGVEAAHRRAYLTRCPVCRCVLEVAPDGAVTGHTPVEWLHEAQVRAHAAESGYREQDLEKKLADCMRVVRTQKKIIERSGPR